MRHACTAALLSLLIVAGPFHESRAAPIPISNSGFDNTAGLSSTLSGNNQFDFASNSYSGWSEFNSSNGLPALGNNNVGPINVSPADLTAEAISEPLALYQQNATVVVDQTTSHTIGFYDNSFTLTVWAGEDSTTPRLGEYLIALYATNGSTKTILKQIAQSTDGGHPTHNQWKQFTLTIGPTELAGQLGKQIGVRLGNETSAAPVFYDDVALSFEVPEPTVLGALALASLSLIRLRSRN